MSNPNSQSSSKSQATHESLADLVHHRAATDGDRIAYTFLVDGAAETRSLTWSQLAQRASALAAILRQQGAAGQRVLLTLPSGLAFVESLFACWYAGATAVPVSLPRNHRIKHRLDRIIADADAHFAIASPDTRQRLTTGEENITLTTNLTWLNPETINDNGPAPATLPPPAPPRHTALLQYTSGSTGSPRGVIVTHANLMQNSALIAQACGHLPTDTIAGWLPLFHDMGLVGLVLQAAYTGARCVFMSPERFLMRPWLWLQMISDYKARSSPAPNFAYDLCTERITPEQKEKLNLSHWQNALNGSEPVRPATLERFAIAFASCGFKREAFFPCYGLAEATLFVTGPGKNRELTRRTPAGKILADTEPGGHIACGQTFGDTQLAIVDTKTIQRVPEGQIGEIWITGKSFAAGYWNNPEATAATFNAQLPETPENKTIAPTWFRSGDLGFIADGQLFITGRLRELIILSGRNFFPVDLEHTIESADPAIAPSSAAAFSVEAEGIERLIIAAEVRREYTRPAKDQPLTTVDPEAIRQRLRAALVAEHEIAPHDIVLLNPGALPRTTSGKISRRTTHDSYLNNTLDQL